MKNFFEEIHWRNMISGHTHGAQNLFSRQHQPLVAYIGFDPTAKHLHIGNLAAVHMLRHFQLCGNKPIILVGGGTGFIGDPAGKNTERKFLAKDTIEQNVQSLKLEFSNFLDFDKGEFGAEILNNLDWLGEIGLIEFLREYGKGISVNEMIKRDSVKDRLKERGISYTEFSYQVLQAYDFYWLTKNRGCQIQMGGSDQWGNIIAGIDMVSKKLNVSVHGITLPLIEKEGGGKFGKTEEGNIWVNETLTSSFKFYQFWRNVLDADLPKLLRIFTFFDAQKIRELDTLAVDNPNQVKEILADEMTSYIHGRERLNKIKRISKILFDKNNLEELEALDEKDLIESSEVMRKVHISKSDYEVLSTVLDLISFSFSLSKSEVRKLVKNNGIYINKSRVNEDVAARAFVGNLIKDKFLLLQKGKTYCWATIEH